MYNLYEDNAIALGEKRVDLNGNCLNAKDVYKKFISELNELSDSRILGIREKTYEISEIVRDPNRTAENTTQSRLHESFDFGLCTANVLSVEIADVYLRSKSKNKHFLIPQIIVCD